MKKTLITFLMLTLCIVTKAQDYFINFNAVGDTTVLSEIRIINFKSHDTVVIGGNDVLHLVYWTVGIKNKTPKDVTEMSIFPNPMTDGSTIKFYSPTTGNTSIDVYDLLGKLLYKKEINTLVGENSFFISGLNCGTYIVRVLGKNYSYSSKLVSVGYQTGITVNFLSNIPHKSGLKSTESTLNEVEMTYTTGDILQYKATSGIYVSYIMDIPTSSKTETFHIYRCVDADGHSYSTVRGKKLALGGKSMDSLVVDTLVWMAENLNVGTQVGMGGQLNNNIIEKNCYDNDSSNCTVYGGLYQWDEMMKYTTTNGAQGICPDGWHVPTNEEFAYYIINFTGGGLTYGGVNMKEVGSLHWIPPFDDGTDSLGFTALPNGVADYYYSSPPQYINLGLQATWWTSTEYNTTDTYMVLIQAPSFEMPFVNKQSGLSVRCVHDY